MLKVESEAAENSILEEFQKGFLLNNKVIRHAKVKLSAGKKKGSNQNTSSLKSENKTETKNGDNDSTLNDETKTKHD